MLCFLFSIVYYLLNILIVTSLAGFTKPGEEGEILAIYQLMSPSLAKLKSP
jgi:hypothetical protein